MPAIGQIYWAFPKTKVGPWSNGRHTGMVVSKEVPEENDAVIVVPITTTQPRKRPKSTVELSGPLGPVPTPAWAKCHYAMALPVSELDGPIHVLPRNNPNLILVRKELLRLLGFKPSDTVAE